MSDEPFMNEEQRKRFHEKLNELWPVGRGMSKAAVIEAVAAAQGYAWASPASSTASNEERSDEAPHPGKPLA